MNTKEVSVELAKRLNEEGAELSIASCNFIVKTLLDIVEENVAAGAKVKLSGFGVFYSNKRKARVGRNPKSGAPVKIPAKNVARFKAGKKFKDILTAK